jgi:hypothetical protein
MLTCTKYSYIESILSFLFFIKIHQGIKKYFQKNIFTKLKLKTYKMQIKKIETAL